MRAGAIITAGLSVTILAFAGGALGAGCSTQPGGAAPGIASDGGSEGGADTWVAPPVTCDGGIYVGSVSGKVLDTSGSPPTSTAITVCGNACVLGKLAGDGTFTIAANTCYLYEPDAADFFSVPVFQYHGEPQYAGLTVNFLPQGPQWVDSATIGFTMYTVASANLGPKLTYDPNNPTSLVDGAGFSLTAAAGAISLPPGETDLAAGAVDPKYFPLGPDAGAATLSALYVVIPVGSQVTPPASVLFPNVAKLAPGTAVDLLAIGDLPTAPAVAPGTLGVIGSGHVTSDGTSVESIPGTDTGLTMLGWIGYRPKKP